MDKNLPIELLLDIINHSQQGVIILSPALTVESLNQKAKELLGTSLPIQMGQPLMEISPEFFVLDKIIEGIITLSNGTRLRTRLQDLTTSKLYSGYILFLDTIPGDEKWNLLSNIINSIDDAILVCDYQGHFIEYNDANARMDGLLREQVLGKHVTHVYMMTDAQSLLLQTIKQQKPILNRHQNYTTYTGRKIDIMCSTFPLFENNEVVGAVSVMKDYSQIKELSEKIIELQEQLFRKGKETKSKKFVQAKFTFDQLVGISSCIRQTITWAKRSAKSSSHVLIYGETGTGKELFAQSIHNASNRANNPFVAVNCAAIPENLLEGILFGTVKGAYTGAIDRPGLFEQAHRGTLLLDEMNSMSIGLQAKLLRVLQESTIRRLGDINEIPVDVRIISNINVEPLTAIKEKHLREDLYYRLSAVYLEIPPLRHRIEDIPLLARTFIDKYNHSLRRNITEISPLGLEIFMNYSWPGNVREFQHVIESAMNIIEDHETVLHPIHFHARIRNAIQVNSSEATSITVPLEVKPLTHTIEELERVVILNALQNNKWNVSRTAKLLDIKRQSLQYRIRKYGIKQNQ